MKRIQGGCKTSKRDIIDSNKILWNDLSPSPSTPTLESAKKSTVYGRARGLHIVIHGCAFSLCVSVPADAARRQICHHREPPLKVLHPRLGIEERPANRR